HVVLGYNPTAAPLEKIKQNQLVYFVVKKLLEVKAGVVTLDLKEKAILDGRLEMANEADAEKLDQLLPGLMRGGLAFLKQNGMLEEVTAKKLEPIFTDIKVERAGKSVTLKGETDAGAVALALATLAPRLGGN